MTDFEEIALQGASIFLRLVILASNAVLDPGSFPSQLALHRISPLECLYDVITKLTDIIHFVLYNPNDQDSGIVFMIPETHLPIRLALNIPTIYHAYSIFSLKTSYWTKISTASYILCWALAKIQLIRSRQQTIAERDSIRRKIICPVFFASGHCIICFAVFDEVLAAALWAWVGLLFIAGLALFVSPTPRLVNPQRNPEVDLCIRIILHIACLGLVYLFQFSHVALQLRIQDGNWNGDLKLKVAMVGVFDLAMVFLVMARVETWSVLRFVSIGVAMVGMAYFHYVEVYALVKGLEGMLA